jgi:hypothetical protein
MDQGTKMAKMLCHIMDDIGLPNVAHPTPLNNNNRGSVDWSQGVSLSKRLCHMNIQEVGIRDGIRLQHTHIHHIPGSFDVADIFTKDYKSSVTFTQLSHQLIFPHFNSLHHKEQDSDKENIAPVGWNLQ